MTLSEKWQLEEVSGQGECGPFTRTGPVPVGTTDLGHWRRVGKTLWTETSPGVERGGSTVEGVEVPFKPRGRSRRRIDRSSRERPGASGRRRTEASVPVEPDDASEM